MTFLAPGWLWLLLAIPLVWLVPSRLTDVRHGVLRSLVFLFLIFGMAQPVAIGDGAEPHIVYVAETTKQVELARRIAANRSGAQHVLVTAAEASGFDDIVTVEREVPTAFIDRALDAAARSIPHGAPGAVMVLADGQSQSGTYGPGLQALTSRGILVHAAPSGHVAPPGIERVDVLEPLRVGRTARLRVEVRGGGAAYALNQPINQPFIRPTVEAWSGRLIASAPVPALPEITNGLEDMAATRSAIVTFEPERAGFMRIQLVLGPTPDGEDPLGDEYAEVVLPVQEPVCALYLGERMVEGGNQLSALIGKGVSLETRALDGENPKDVLDGLDLVVLDDRPADTLPEAFQKELVSAVRDRGLGLVVSGGRAAFGAGGWHKSPIASVLPIEFLHREEKRDPSTTLVVIIDTSGSMGGGRVQLAKEVARLAIRRLLPHDKVGIVEFYGAKRWAAPIQPASNSIEIERALNRLNAGGGTVILPAIEESFYGLQNVRTRYKHVLVLTDGGVERGSFEPLLRKMADKGINVSTVLVGSQSHSEFLVSIANWGKGRFYGVPNRFNLPEVILKQPASARLPAYRPGTHTVKTRGGPRWWGETPPDTLPPLKGYVETKTRPGAETLIEVTQGRRPVLSTWRYGLGRVTALMTEPTGPGTEGWKDWDGYGSFLARVLARTASDLRSPYAFSLRRLGHRWQVIAQREVAGAADPVVERVTREEAPVGPVALRRRADDVFTGLLPHDVELPFLLCGADDGGRTPQVRVAADPNVLMGMGITDTERGVDLARLTEATGGTLVGLDDLERFVPSTSAGARPLSVTRIQPWLLLLALLCYLLDVFHRRRERSTLEVA